MTDAISKIPEEISQAGLLEMGRHRIHCKKINALCLNDPVGFKDQVITNE
jgi:hypothetical protein